MSSRQASPACDITDERRYARQIVLPEIGKAGQAKLAKAKILVVGAGGLGAPALLYLAAAGIGTLGIIDHDKVELSNLQRQVLFETSDIGRKKVDAATDALADLNPDIRLEPHATRLTTENAEALFTPYDLILDGSDNLPTRYAVNDACANLCKPLISAAIQGFEGQLYVFPFQNPNDPCYRCLYPDVPTEAMPDCRTAGVLGALAGIMGNMQALEAIKWIVGITNKPLFLRYNSLNQRLHTATLAYALGCPAHPRYKD